MVFRENTEGLYVRMGGNFKKGTPDEVAIEEDLNTRKGVERIIRHAFEYARGDGPHEGVHGRQVQRAHPRARPVAARLQGGRGASIPGIEATPPVRRRPLRCRWCASPAQFEVIVTSTCSATSSPTSARRCRAAWAWRPPGNIHPGQLSLFEPVHGSAPDVRGQERGQPDGRDPHRGADARAPRLDRGGARASRTRSRWAVEQGRTTADIGRHAGHARGGRRHRAAAARLSSSEREARYDTRGPFR